MARQPLNALEPICETVAGNSSDGSDEQLKKALLPTDSSCDGSLKDVRLRQLSKNSSGIALMASGRAIDVSEVQFLKLPVPIVRSDGNVDGVVRLLQPSNALSPRLESLSGKTTSPRVVQP